LNDHPVCRDWLEVKKYLFFVLICFFAGIIDIKEILHGLSNDNIILIFVLLVISDIIKASKEMKFEEGDKIKKGTALGRCPGILHYTVKIASTAVDPEKFSVIKY